MLHIQAQRQTVTDDLAQFLQDEYGLAPIPALDLAEGIVEHLGERFRADLAEIEQVKQTLRDIVVEIASD